MYLAKCEECETCNKWMQRNTSIEYCLKILDRNCYNCFEFLIRNNHCTCKIKCVTKRKNVKATVKNYIDIISSKENNDDKDNDDKNNDDEDILNEDNYNNLNDDKKFKHYKMCPLDILNNIGKNTDYYYHYEYYADNYSNMVKYYNLDHRMPGYYEADQYFAEIYCKIVEGGNVEFLKYIINKGYNFDQNKCRTNILIRAIHSRNFDMFKFVYEHHIKNIDENTHKKYINYDLCPEVAIYGDLEFLALPPIGKILC